MPTPFDKDELGNKAVLDFSSIRKRNIDKTALSQNQSPIKQDSFDKEEMKLRLSSARLYADKEIEKYKELVNTFCNEVEKLTLFKSAGDAVEGICLDYILNLVIDPILKGNKPYGMPDDTFRAIRREMYKDLMESYTDK